MIMVINVDQGNSRGLFSDADDGHLRGWALDRVEAAAILTVGS